jgi:hypothetical protein
MPFHKLESNYFGVNHAELGAEMARRWEFPDGLQLAITYHHAPSECKVNSLLPSTVHLADALVTMLGIGIGRDGLQYSIDHSYFPSWASRKINWTACWKKYYLWLLKFQS